MINTIEELIQKKSNLLINSTAFAQNEKLLVITSSHINKPSVYLWPLYQLSCEEIDMINISDAAAFLYENNMEFSNELKEKINIVNCNLIALCEFDLIRNNEDAKSILTIKAADIDKWKRTSIRNRFYGTNQSVILDKFIYLSDPFEPSPC